MEFPNHNLLAYIGIADAYAASVEYIKFPLNLLTRNQSLAFKGYVQHPIHTLQKGHYTDDTEMSAANAHVLIEHDHCHDVEIGPQDQGKESSYHREVVVVCIACPG